MDLPETQAQGEALGEGRRDVRRDGRRRAIVVGGGITGVAAAERLRRADWAVTLIDRAVPGDRGAASFGNAGVLARCSIAPVPVPGLLAKAPGMLLDSNSPLYLRWSYLPRMLPFLARYLAAGREAEVRRIAAALADLLSDSVDQHQALAEGTPAARFIQTGDYGFLYRDRAGYEADAYAHALRRVHGYEPELLGRDAILARAPGLSDRYACLAAFADHGWISDPGAYVAALAEHFVREGGVVRRGEVAALDGEGKVTLKGGAVMRADKVILAAGAWSRDLARGLGLKLSMESERGYHLALHGASHRPAHPMMIAEAKAVATPMDFGLRLAGIVEFGGLEAGPSAAPARLLEKTARMIFPGMIWDRAEPWMGHRPCLSDSLPAIGPIPGAPAVIAAFGGQHVGLTAGPRIGLLAAEAAMERPQNLDLRPYAPGRFSGKAA